MIRRRRGVVHDSCPGHRAASGVWIRDVCFDNVDLGRQTRNRVTGDGPHRETSTDELVDHGSADRSETGDDVEIRLWHGGLVLSGSMSTTFT
jgi:hypothetical protein